MTLAFALVILGYLALTIFFWRHWLDNQSKPIKLGRWAAPVVTAHLILVAHAILLGPGQNLVFTHVAALITLMLTATMTATHERFKFTLMLPPLYLLAAISLVPALLVEAEFITHIEAKPAVLLHIGLSITAYATMLLAALFALEIAVIDYRLKNHMPIHPLLPPLLSVERQLQTLLYLGFALLTLAIASGMLFLDGFLSSGHAHKSIFTIIGWILYLIVLWRHRSTGVSSRGMVIATISGIGILTLAYFGSTFVKQVLLG